MEPRLDRVYQLLSGDDGSDRACRDIPDALCTALPRNYLLNLANGACTKLAEQIASPGLVLPWLLSALGTPAGIIGFLVPVRQAGALLPQLAVAARIRAVAVRKWVWAGAGLSQALMLLLMVLAALVLSPLAAGWAIVGLLTVFSMASGAGSVAYQDVTGKTVPKGRRGRLLAARALWGGVLTLVVVLPLSGLADDRDIVPVLWLITGGAGLWALAALCFAAIQEAPGATAGGRNMLGEAREGLRLMREQTGFRRFLITRGLLITVEVAAPYYALLAQDLYGHGAGNLVLYVMTLGLATVISSPFWGRFSDTDARGVLILSAWIAAAAGAVALLLSAFPAFAGSPYAYTPVFLLIGIAESGVKLGRKTYLVDAAPKDERALYVAFSNTAIGALTLAAGFLGLLAQWLGSDAVIGLLVLLAVAAALSGLRLARAEAMTTI